MINKEEITEIIRKLSYTGYTEQDIKSEAIRIIENLQKKAELGEHYKHLYSEVKKQYEEADYDRHKLFEENQQLKKQKDDVVDFIHKELDRFDCEGSMSISMRISYFEEDLLRMLGEIDG